MTGVQTCALPILTAPERRSHSVTEGSHMQTRKTDFWNLARRVHKLWVTEGLSPASLTYLRKQIREPERERLNIRSKIDKTGFGPRWAVPRHSGFPVFTVALPLVACGLTRPREACAPQNSRLPALPACLAPPCFPRGRWQNLPGRGQGNKRGARADRKSVV